MKTFPGFIACLSILCALLLPSHADAENLPDSFGCSISGSFLNDTADPVSSADVVSLRSQSAPINLSDNAGHHDFSELTFQVDQDTLDGTHSPPNQLRVFEGGTGQAIQLARIATNPIGDDGSPMVPEPSAALIGSIGLFFLLCRRR